MARGLVTFATRKRLTSFVGRPDCLRRQAHPAQPSTPCIRLSRLWRSFTTSRMKRVGKCAEDERSESKGSRADCAAIERTSEAKWPQGAAHGGVVRGEQRPLPPQRRQGRLRRLRVVEAAPLQGHVGRLEVRPHLPAFRLERVARALRGPEGRNIPRGRRPSWLAERSEPAGSQEPERPSSAARPLAEVRAGRTSPRSSRPPTTSADARQSPTRSSRLSRRES